VFATAHLTSGLALGLALGLRGWPLAVLVLASMLTDWDFALQLWTGKNHRGFLSHSPPVVAAVLILLALWQPILFWALAGAMLHFSLDVWEYGIRLNPFSRKIYGFRLLPGVEREPFVEYLRHYFTDWRFAGAEIVLALVAVVLGIRALS
jgi:hypothetical protein